MWEHLLQGRLLRGHGDGIALVLGACAGDLTRWGAQDIVGVSTSALAAAT